MVDVRFYELLKHLGRGGSHQYYWTPDTDEGKLSFWFPSGKPKEISPLWKTINVYFGVHPSRIEKAIRERAKIEDIEAINCLFAEFDLAPGQTPEHLLESIQQIDIPPSVIIFSGGGYHCYWLLEQTYHIDSDDARQRIIDIQYAWVDYTGSDGAAKDLARVLRVPGTFNRKPERGPNYPEAKIVKFDLDDTHSLDDFALLVEKIIEQTKTKRVEVANTDVTPVDLDDQTILEKMFEKDAAAVALWAGDMTAQGDDHSSADLDLCNRLAFWFGRDKSRIDRVFRRSGLFRPKWLRDDYRNKTIDKAIAGTTNTYTPAGSNFGNVQGLVTPVSTNGHTTSGTTSTPPPQAGTPAAAKQKKTTSADYIQTLATLGYQFRLNELDDTVEVNNRKLNDIVAAQIRTQMRDLGHIYMSPIEDAYLAHAASNRFHPVKHYLQSLRWDGNDYISMLAAFIKDDHSPIVYPDGTRKTVFHVWFKRWLVGAVGKVFGHAQNPMLVLDGGQGSGKSTFAHWVGSPMPQFFIESPIRPDDKEFDRYLATKWIWEVAEVGATTRRQDVEALKHYLTKEEVTFRIPWGRHAVVKPALASFIGTINNETGFLTDTTGNRRFVSVRLTSIDWNYKKIDINQIWAQAYTLWKSGESNALLPEELENRGQINTEYQIEDPYEAWVLRYYDVDSTKTTWKATTQEIVDLLQAKGIRGETRAIQMHIAKTLKTLGLQQNTSNRPRTWQGIKSKPMPGIP